MQAQQRKLDKNRIKACFGGENRLSAAILVSRSMLAVVLGLPGLSLAAAASDELSLTTRSIIPIDEIAMELSNPVTGLRSLTWDIEGTTFQGNLPDADDKSAMKNIFTFSWPFKLKNGKNLLLSATIPHFSDQPLWELAWWDHSAEWRLRQREDIRLDDGYLARGHDHMADIGIDVGYGGVRTAPRKEVNTYWVLNLSSGRSQVGGCTVRSSSTWRELAKEETSMTTAFSGTPVTQPQRSSLPMRWGTVGR
jgi:hypothetical protein